MFSLFFAGKISGVSHLISTFHAIDPRVNRLLGEPTVRDTDFIHKTL